ncbi:MAG: 4Fe-4S dicluster domain-containing protein [Ruminococcus flavefaciens]|nr:4Fe-4S dicluster domain-containing protein [Ruminococcus flavefaciens]MCM1362123.1 4Fe-4S dicluster domain-containing protein [Clostridiales bacterium]MCM1435430.1 4Fe-4S dicluster domain-containing protein [Ruminococcus flavefaciens]
MKNVENNVNKKVPELFSNKANCCGCSACYAVCPVSAIEMKEDEEGFCYPVIDEKKCLNCKKCLSVCVFKIDQKKKGFLV